MDVKALKERAVEATTRFFVDKHGFAPDEDSEEWEDEYRRQFELLKRRYATKTPAEAARIADPVHADERSDALPELSGAPADRRWATSLRSERLKLVPSKALRFWLAGAWTSAKDWLDTRDLAAQTFLHRVEEQHAEHRRRSEQRAMELQAERRTRAAAIAADQREVAAAGITAAGLVELVDVSPRAAPEPFGPKLAELDAGDRSLRVFETGNPDILMVIENAAAGRQEYAIERDEQLVADLKLFARGQAS